MQKTPFIQNNVGDRGRFRQSIHQEYQSSSISKPTKRSQQILNGGSKTLSSHLESAQVKRRYSKYEDDSSSSRQRRIRQAPDILPQASRVPRYFTRLEDSRQRLSENNHCESKAEILLSLRQSNVIRSPRVYNFSSSAAPQNETLKSEGPLGNSRNGKLQQVTIGPTVSDSICEMFFQPQNSATERPSREVSSSSRKNHRPGQYDSSPRQPTSHSNASRKPYFERYSDAKLPPTNKTDSRLQEKRLPRHLVSTSSTVDRNTGKMIRLTDNKYVSHMSKETDHVHPIRYQKSTVPTHYNPSVRQSTAINRQRPNATRDNEYMSSRSGETGHFQMQSNHAKAQKLAFPARENQPSRDRTALNSQQAYKRHSDASSTAGSERRRPQCYVSKESNNFQDSRRHKVYQRAPEYYDAFKRYSDDSAPQLASRHGYFVDQSNKIPSSIDLDQFDISSSQFESIDYNVDSFNPEDDVTMRDADREHYLNQKVLQKVTGNRIRDEIQEEQHLVGSSYESSYTDTRSDRSSNRPILTNFEDQSSVQQSSSESESSSESLHISELDADSDTADYKDISSPAKSNLKSKSRLPTLMDDFRVYHKMRPGKQVHFKEPISVAATISTITLEELGFTSESSDHDINVVELEEDHIDHSIIHEASLSHDIMTTELESKRLQDAGNTPKAVRTKRPANCEIFASELENKPSLIQSFEESSFNHDSKNAGFESCCHSEMDKLSGHNSQTYHASKISKGTKTGLHLSQHPKSQSLKQGPQHSSYKKHEINESVAECNGLTTPHQTKEEFHCDENFVGHRRGDGGPYRQNERERSPNLSYADSSDKQQAKVIFCEENIKGHNHGNRRSSVQNKRQLRSNLPPEASSVAGNSQLRSPLSTIAPSSLVNAVAPSPNDTVTVPQLPSEFQRIVRYPNPPMISTQSNDYRKMRLQAVIDCSPLKEKQNIIIKARYFRRWKDNVRLLVRVKKREQRKLMRAETFYRITTLAKHFFSWRGFILEQQIAADEFHYRCMLKKGISALRWATMNTRIKTKQAHLGRKKVKLSSCFRKWRVRFDSRRIDTLGMLFFHWRQRLHENLIIAKFESNRSHTKQHQVFKTWRRRFLCSMQVRISLHHYKFVLTQKIWHTWRVYTADQLVKSSQREVAVVEFQFRLLCKSFRMWKRMSQQKQSVRRFRNKKILSSSLQKWRYFTPFESLRHQKELNGARQARRKHLLSRHFHIWVTQLRLLNFKKERINSTLRCCLLVWRSQMNRHRVIHAEVTAHHNLVVKKYVLDALKKHAVNQKCMRQNAVQELERGILRRHLKGWHSLAARKSKHRDMQDLFRSNSIKKCKRRLFSKWKSQYAVALEDHEAEMQWSMTCVKKAACKWLRLLQLKQMKRLCDKTIAARDRSILQNSLHIWKTELHRILRQYERVNEAKQHLTREKLRNILRRWCLRSYESSLIEPFVKALQERRISRHFNSWMLFVRRKSLMQAYRKKLSLSIARTYFTEWKRQLDHVKNVRMAEKGYNSILMRRGLKGWIQFSNRCHGYTLVSNQRKRVIVAQCFSTWAAKTKFRQIEESVKRRDHAIKRANAQQLLARWKEEATIRRESKDLLMSGFIEQQTRSMKRATFASWRDAFENLQKAENFASENTRMKLKGLLQEWHAITEVSIQAQLTTFTLSMMPQHKRNFKNKEAHCDWTVRSDITETDSLNENPYSDEEINDCFETELELLSLSELANARHANGIEIAPLVPFQNVAATPGTLHSVGFPANRNLEINTQINCCGDSGILSKDVTTATPSENDDSSTSSIPESVRSSKQDMPFNKTLTLEDLMTSQDSNIGSSVMEGPDDEATATIQASTESISSLSSGCSDDPTLSSSTLSQSLSADPFLRPILSDLSHLASLPIDHTCKWEHKPKENNYCSESVTCDSYIMAHAVHGQENPKLPILRTLSHKVGDGTNAMMGEENSPTISHPASPMNFRSNHSGSGCSPEYCTPECTPTQYGSSFPVSEITPSAVTCQHLHSPESLPTACLAGENPFSPEKLHCNSIGLGSVESSVLLALSHPATHISDLSSTLYFTPHCTPSRRKSQESPYPSGVTLLSPLQNLESRKSLDIMTEQMEQHFSLPNYQNQEVVLQYDDIQNVVVHSAKCPTDSDSSLAESDDTRSLTSVGSHELSCQQVERSTEDSHSQAKSCNHFPLASRLKLPTHLALRDPGVSATEWLVRFALVRLRHRPVAFAFHQWKLLIHMKLWKQEMLIHAGKLSEHWRVKQHFRIWKSVTSQMRIAQHHFYITMMRKYFSTILTLTQYRVKQRRMLTKALFQKNRKVLATNFNHWQGKFQQKAALLDILQYWQRKARTNNPSNHKESRFQTRKNHEKVSECFYHWRMKTQQIEKVTQYQNGRLMSRCFLSWRIWASDRGFQIERVENFYSRKLKMKVFQTLKEHVFLLQTAKQQEIDCRKKFLSTLLNRWHVFTQSKKFQRSTFRKLSAKKIFKTKALCFNNWRCEVMKRNMAEVSYRRTLMKKILNSWKEAADYETYEKQSCGRVQELIENHSKEAVLVKWLDEVLIRSKVSSLKRKHIFILIVECWNIWKDKVALKKSDELYETFLKKRSFYRWVSILRMKRERNEKIRAMLRRWHAISSRSKKLSTMADQFQLKSNSLMTDITFNLWLIAWEQSQKARLHHDHKIMSRIFPVWKLWNRRKRALQRMVLNHLQYRSKERFAIAWHTWKHRYRVRLVDMDGIMLYKKAAAIRTLRYHWLIWRRKKLENDSSKFYDNKLLHQTTQTWLVKFERLKRADSLRRDHVNRRLRKVLLAWHGHVTSIKCERKVVTDLNDTRSEIVTMTMFMTWLKAYRNNVIADSSHERILKRKCFASLVLWRRKRKSLQNSYIRTVHTIDVIMLSSCLSQWKSIFRKSRMLQVSCDQMLDLKRMWLLRKLWQKWFRAKEKRDIKKMHLNNLVIDAAKKWKSYAVNCANKRRIKEERVVMVEQFKHKWLCKIYFSYWYLQFKGNRMSSAFQTRITQRCWNMWKKKTTMSICAASISRHRMLYSSWRIWRLEFVMLKAVKESVRDRKKDLTKIVFKAWRSLIFQTKTGMQEYKLMQSPHKRKSRIPILQK